MPRTSRESATCFAWPASQKGTGAWRVPYYEKCMRCEELAAGLQAPLEISASS